MSAHNNDREYRADMPENDIPNADTERSDEGDDPGAELKNQYAIGLDVDPETGLPRVTTIARGRIARMLLDQASRKGVPVEENPDLVQRMFKPVDGRVIPSRTYQVIAEILTFVYQLNEAFTREDIAEKLEVQPIRPDFSEEDPDTESEMEESSGLEFEEGYSSEYDEGSQPMDYEDDETGFEDESPEERRSLRSLLEEEFGSDAFESLDNEEF